MGDDMKEHVAHGPSYRDYVAVFAGLAVLTAATVALSYSGLAEGLRHFLAFTIATAKAVLVGMIFMHLRFDRRLIVACAVTPVVLAILFILAIAPDIGKAP
jgi:caa(3)-type oxidase subunit IV